MSQGQRVLKISEQYHKKMAPSSFVTLSDKPVWIEAFVKVTKMQEKLSKRP